MALPLADPIHIVGDEALKEGASLLAAYADGASVGELGRAALVHDLAFRLQGDQDLFKRA